MSAAADQRDDERAAVALLRRPETIRERCERIYERGLAGELEHFAIDEARLPAVADRVIAVTRAAYPDLRVPPHSRWGHFRVGGVDRLAELEPALAAFDPAERARTLIDLVVVSVLLDAGAGDRWRYTERETGLVSARSEGLAVASFRMFAQGAFSSDRARPLRADAQGLANTTEAALAAGFQAGDDNPLVGVAGRAALLTALGGALAGDRSRFGDPGRPGGLFDSLRAQAGVDAIPARAVLAAILEGLGAIWPGRTFIGETNLGDVWPHPAAGGEGLSAGLVPFHKLSQWLSYSLLEPLEAGGLRVIETEALTGLPEYRNGGLLIDLGALVPKHPAVTGDAHRPGDPIIVEWRALTVALLDRVAEHVRDRLGLDAAALPLASVLEGGTWRTGREVARELRADGRPPIAIVSDGTVF